MNAPSRGQSIHIYLVNGHPEGLRIVTRPGWTGSVLAFSRADYAEARTRQEFQRSGIYVLIGPSNADAHNETAYIGEGDVVLRRLDDHHQSKDFWTRGYVITSHNDFLHKAHIRYLESRLIRIAMEAETVTLENGTAPEPSGLGEAEAADMESFLDTVLPLFPLLGVQAFDTAPATLPTAHATTPAGASSPATPRDRGRILRLNDRHAQAEGQDDPRGFIVLAGSLARRATGAMGGYTKIREQLVRDGVLVDSSATQLRFSRSFVFESPSAAATVVCGSSRNGRTAWKSANGLSLKQLQEQEISNPSSTLENSHASPPRNNNAPAPSDGSGQQQRSATTSNARREKRLAARAQAPRVKYDEDIALLLDLGYLESGDAIHFQDRKNEITHIGTIEPDGAIRVGLVRYGAPSTALTVAVGYSVNGWVTWRLDDGRTLDDLRKLARGQRR